MILLKTVQRPGYFPMLAEVPASIGSFVTKALGVNSIPLRMLIEEEKSRARQTKRLMGMPMIKILAFRNPTEFLLTTLSRILE